MESRSSCFSVSPSFILSFRFLESRSQIIKIVRVLSLRFFSLFPKKKEPFFLLIQSDFGTLSPLSVLFQTVSVVRTTVVRHEDWTYVLGSPWTESTNKHEVNSAGTLLLRRRGRRYGSMSSGKRTSKRTTCRSQTECDPGAVYGTVWVLDWWDWRGLPRKFWQIFGLGPTLGF